MSPSSKLLLAFFLLIGCRSLAQDCDITISGIVIDLNTREPIDHAHCFLASSGAGTATDPTGHFSLSGICPGEDHLIVSHVGCSTERHYLSITTDTFLTLYLDHHAYAIDPVTVMTGQDPQQKQLSKTELAQSGDRHLADLLSSLEGVSVLRNGATIGKPIVNGLYGNRLQIINNGLPHAGQQWGNDHAPEVDPAMVDKMTVIQGAAAIVEQANALGTIVKVDRTPIQKDPHLHGQAAWNSSTNGRRLGGSTKLFAGYDKVSWRWTAAGHTSGDRHTPDYFLRNTGSRQWSTSGEVHCHPSDRLRAELLLSHLETDIGILRGSHIGNLTDLASAFSAEQPFFTEPDFSRSIDNPRQDVSHSLAKASLKYFLDDRRWIEASYGLQLNQRSEYDVRRLDRGERPALRLTQIGQHFAGRYISEAAGRLELGVQLTGIDNENGPETGILPLIPDYLSLTSGAFAYYRREIAQWQVEVAGRLDYTTRSVATISNTVPREIIRYEEDLLNYQGGIDLGYQLSKTATLTWQSSIAARNPSVNELYAQGLHQGISGIEEGNTELGQELSLLQALQLTTTIGKSVYLRARAYHRWIDDYIFLAPTEELRLTIRGAFPVYAYQQTDARLYGVDLSTKVQWHSRWANTFSASLIRSDDRASDLPLVNIPTDRCRLALQYTANHAGPFEEVSLEAAASYVGSQSDLLAEIEFVPPPAGYGLVDFRASASYPMGSNALLVFVRCDNLLNARYRDYLNRLRYFADEAGRDVTLGMQLKF